MLVGDLRQTQSGTAVLYNLLAIHIEPISDLATFQPCPAHATFDTFNDE